MNPQHTPDQPTAEGDLRETVEQLICDLPDGFSYHDTQFKNIMDEIMQAIANTKEKTLEWYLEELPAGWDLTKVEAGRTYYAAHYHQYDVKGDTPLQAVKALHDKLKGEGLL